MRDENTIVRERQKLIRREMDRRGILLKQVQLDGGWKTVSTVASYFPQDGGEEPATMSVASLFRLIQSNALPVDLLSLLLPDGHQIVRVPEEIDHDELADHMREWLAAKDHAHHPESPGGREIAPCEDATLRAKVVPIASAA